MSVKLELPFPHNKTLGGNSRGHTRWKNEFNQAAKNLAYCAALETFQRGLFKRSDRLRITVLSHPATTGDELDWDNLTTAIKYYQDGICRALGINDRKIREGHVYLASPAPPDGRVEIILERIEDV